MRVALDTNRYVDLCKGVGETVALLEEAEAIVLPFVVLGELRAGFVHGRRQAENERILRRFLLKDGVLVLFADDQRHVAGGAGPAAQPGPARPRQALRSLAATCPCLNRREAPPHTLAGRTVQSYCLSGSRRGPDGTRRSPGTS